jgi:hypothetical protein
VAIVGLFSPRYCVPSKAKCYTSTRDLRTSNSKPVIKL